MLFFWFAFGLLNYPHKSSVWFAHRRPWLFAFFYIALSGTSYIVDQFGLTQHLWFYPLYRGADMLWVVLVLYPFGGLAVLELLYFLGGYLGEPLTFRERSMTKWHGFFDVLEHIIFFGLMGAFIAGALRTGTGVLIPVTVFLALLWMITALIKLRFHIHHSGHYSLIIVCTVLLAALSHELPNTVAREWVYLEAPLSSFFNYLLLGLPVWVWLGWFFLVLLPLRLWIFLVLHPRVR
ncbi:MAG: hypothetical protein UY50_C0018G0017 [Parcubacteria group bacterium GW2011_GWA2_49_9]|nr:MAG: hypothetical protein UY50_C0018G0017 [Parcubacteria group bacterium GW2011_GWA2_49_9]